MLDEINPMALALGIVAGIFGFWMTGFMNPNSNGFFKVVVALVCLVGGYFLSSFIADK